MPYIKEVCIAGRTKEVVKKYSTRFGRKIPRTKGRLKGTSEEQKRVNERAAATNLRRIINHNFETGDYHLILTYSTDKRPEDAEVARKDMERFLRRLRGYFKRHGQELRYIAVTEYKNRNIHHHLVMSYMDAKDLAGLWMGGRVKVNPLDSTGQYKALADYLIKETSKTFKTEQSAYGKRWNQSKTIRKPKIVKTIVRADSWKASPKAERGYYIDSLFDGFHEFTGYPYQFYSMVKTE